MAETESASSGGEPKEVTDIRQDLAKLVLDNATDILKGAIEKAKQGHYSITKLLFSLAGIYPAPAASDAAADHSLADFFCKELGLSPPDPESNDQPQT